MSDCVLDWMKKSLPPEQWTRETYLHLNWLGNPPEMMAELEAEMPEETTSRTWLISANGKPVRGDPGFRDAASKQTDIFPNR
jgi:hypothetical protein